MPSTLPDVTIVVQDGALGTLPANTANLHMTLGTCSRGVPGTVVGVGSLGSIVSQLGYGPLAEELALKLAVGGGTQYGYVMPQTVGGASSSVAKTFGASSNSTGTVAVNFAPDQTITVTTSTAGTCAAAGGAAFTFQLGSGPVSAPVSADVGGAWESTGYTVPGTNTSLLFSSGTFNVGDQFTISNTGVITPIVNVGGGTISSQTTSPFDEYNAVVNIITSGFSGTGSFQWALDHRVSSSGADTSGYSATTLIPPSGVYPIPQTGMYLTFSQPTILIKITTGGTSASGNARFEVNVAGGGYGTAQAITGATSYAIPGTNTTVSFDGVSTWVLNDVYTVNANTGVITRTTGTGPIPPHISVVNVPFQAADQFTFNTLPGGFNVTTDVSNAFNAIATLPYQWSIAQVLGTPGSASSAVTLSGTVASGMSTEFNSYLFGRAIIDCPTVGSLILSGGAPVMDAVDTDSVVASAFASANYARVQYGAGDFDCVSPLTGRIQRRCASWIEGARLALIPIAEDPGKFARGALPYVSSLYRNEAVTPGLDAARAVTLRTFQGVPGYYITRGPTLALTTSDFANIPNCRVIDVACAVARTALLQYVNTTVLVDPTTGYILERVAQQIEANVNAQLEAALVSTGQASATAVQIDRTADILATSTEPVSVFVTPLGYLRYIVATIGFVNPALSQ